MSSRSYPYRMGLQESHAGYGSTVSSFNFLFFVASFLLSLVERYPGDEVTMAL
jgi:hypothetical protein